MLHLLQFHLAVLYINFSLSPAPPQPLSPLPHLAFEEILCLGGQSGL